MGKIMSAKTMKGIYLISGIIMLLILTLPLVTASVTGLSDIGNISFSGIEIAFGKSITVLGEKVALCSMNTMAMMSLLIGPLLLSLFGILTEDGDAESRGVFGLVGSIANIICMIWIAKSTVSSLLSGTYLDWFVDIKYGVAFYVSIICSILVLIFSIFVIIKSIRK